MSTTVRLWSDEELNKAFKGEDLELSTLLLNHKTFSSEEIRRYPYYLRRHYHVVFKGSVHTETIYAPNDEMAWWFAEQEYIPSKIARIVRADYSSARVPRPKKN